MSAHGTCLISIGHCLEVGGKHASKEHMQFLMDCTKICETALDFMGRESEFHADVAQICAKICEACAESCDALGGEEMKACAETCRTCAKSCKAIM